MEDLIFDGFYQGETENHEGISPVSLKEHKAGLYYGLMCTGRRKNNEDTILIPSYEGESTNLISSRCHKVVLPHGYFLFPVADGMGGASSGEVASELAVTVVKEEIRVNTGIEKDYSGFKLKTILQKSLLRAQKEIRATNQNDSSLSGMGTTMVVFIVANNKYVVGKYWRQSLIFG